MKKFLILSLFSFLFSIQSASAATGDVEGYAWGGGVTPNPAGYDGIGWISMNSAGCDMDKNTFPDVACGGNNMSGTILPYAVNIPSANGDLSGYAWSEHYGWISFNASDVSGCPSGTCVAQRVGDDILGWARIISICDTGNAGNAHTRDGHCDANDDGWNAGGWNGWVSLSGGGYGLEVSKIGKRAPTGYPDNTCSTDPSKCTFAYSDELGWIDFSTAGFGSTLKICPNSCTGGGIPYNTLSSFSSFSVPLLACYGTGTCTSGDTNVSGTWIESNPTPDVIALSTSSATPALSTTVSATYTGTNPFADEVITLRYTPPSSPLQSVTATARVSCVPLACPSFSAQTITYCPKDPQRVFNNSCSGTVSCPGTKSCNYDWTEGTP